MTRDDRDPDGIIGDDELHDPRVDDEHVECDACGEVVAIDERCACGQGA